MYPGASDSDEGHEGRFQFFVACCKTAEVFESGEAALDAVAFPAECNIQLALPFAIGLGGDDGDGAGCAGDCGVGRSVGQ